ncbi:hypothetical protein D3C76_1419830 [compost metagenome]
MCTRKSAGGTAISTPVKPPIPNVIRKPSVHNIGGVKVMRPLYMVNNQEKIFTPVGIAITMVMIPKNALTFAPAPMVKKW